MVTLNATLRTEDFGSAGSRRLVRAGKLPAEMYGKDGNVHIILDAHDFDLQLRKLPIGKECEVLVDGKSYKCIFKALQENIMYGTLVHADFQIV
jgi:large subunit ribosomal protein L25